MNDTLIQIFKCCFIVGLTIIALLIVMCFFDNKIEKKIEELIKKILTIKNIEFIYLFVVFLIVISYIFLPGYIEGHDLYDRLSKIQAIANEIQRGNFPAYIFTDYINGYGTGSGLTYMDFFYYIPALLCVIGLPLGLSYKIFIAFIVLITIIISYLSIQKMTKSKYASVIISSIYITSSYYFTDLYFRADLGENLAMAFIPLVVLGLYEIIYRDENNGYYLTIGLVGLYLSHTLSCYLCVYLVLFIVIINIKKIIKDKNRLIKLLLFGIISIGLVSWHWIPMFDHMLSDNMKIANMANIEVERTVASNSVNPFYTILEIFYDNIETSKWTPPGIGIIFIILSVIFYKNKISNDQERKYSKQLIVIGIVFLWMSTTLFPFDLFGKLFNIMEFPWRFYMLVTSCLLLGFSFHCKSIEHNNRIKYRLIGLTVLSILFTYTLFTYDFFVVQPTFSRTYTIKYSTSSGYMVPIEADVIKLKNRGEIITSNSNNVDIEFIKNGTNIDIDYSNNIDADTYLDLPLIYYKGYKAKESQSLLKTQKSTDGLIRVYLINNNGSIDVYYDGLTNCRIIGLVISTISIVIMAIIISKRKYKDI